MSSRPFAVGAIPFSSRPIRMSHIDCVFTDRTIITPMQIWEAHVRLVLTFPSACKDKWQSRIRDCLPRSKLEMFLTFLNTWNRFHSWSQCLQWFCYLRILHLLPISFYFSESRRVPGCNSIADLSLKIVFWTHKFAVGTHWYWKQRVPGPISSKL